MPRIYLSQRHFYTDFIIFKLLFDTFEFKNCPKYLEINKIHIETIGFVFF